MSDSHAGAALDDNTVRCWSDNGNGLLGVGDNAPRGDAANETGDNLPFCDNFWEPPADAPLA
jgi:hypothetical protein